ncbi:TetR/AcrR family acrAB operon transcriptional repressor [Massilia sp. MP_M2]|uniref:TetR family transcriptional regulator n=1 Tax=Massilia sp. MP_M2 TaxID=3071713 RepID=UPI00319E1A03
MVRRTKEEAAATRDSILDAAEILFAKNGVSRTTLQHIATAAGVTRGAIYWHFVDKGAVFSAMMERATMPMDAAVKLAGERADTDPLQSLRNEMMAVLQIVEGDEKARRVFEIATLKTEFTDEVDSARAHKRESVARWRGRLQDQFTQAKAEGTLPASVDPRNASMCMWVMLDGLIRNWIFEPGSFELVELGAELIDTYIAGLRAR